MVCAGFGGSSGRTRGIWEDARDMGIAVPSTKECEGVPESCIAGIGGTSLSIAIGEPGRSVEDGADSAGCEAGAARAENRL